MLCSSVREMITELKVTAIGIAKMEHVFHVCKINIKNNVVYIKRLKTEGF